MLAPSFCLHACRSLLTVNSWGRRAPNTLGGTTVDYTINPPDVTTMENLPQWIKQFNYLKGTLKIK